MYDRLTKIDDVTRGDHWYLEPDDNCFFLGEYTARRGYAHSPTNQLVINLKKPVDRKGRPEYRYKEKAIATIAQVLNSVLRAEVVTFVPVPPSKCRSDPLYDDRLIRVLEAYKARNVHVDYRELIVQRQSTQASHDSEERPSPDELAEGYDFDASRTAHIRQNIIIFDDVLTTGCHFKATQLVLRRHFPGHSIAGVFVARRVPEAEDPLDVF